MMKPFRVQPIIHSHKTPVEVYEAEDGIFMAESASSLANKIGMMMGGPTKHEYSEKYGCHVLGVYKTDEMEDSAAAFKILEVEKDLVEFSNRLNEEIENHSVRNIGNE